MFARFTGRKLNTLVRGMAHDYTYTASMKSSGPRNVTLIPGIYVGPETTSKQTADKRVHVESYGSNFCSVEL